MIILKRKRWPTIKPTIFKGLLDKPIVVVDIETTGMNSHHNRITEIGMIKTDGFRTLEEFHTLINPGRPIPNAVSLLTGITDDTVQMAPYFDDVAEKIYSFFNCAYFMAHNVNFDFSFIKRQLSGLGYDFQPRLLCSVKLSRHLYPQVQGHSLEKIIQRLGIQVDARHRALEDAFAVTELLRIAREALGDEAVAEGLKRQLKYKMLPSNIQDEALSKLENRPGVYIFRDLEQNPLYVGKSVNVRNRVLSHFTQADKISKELKINMHTHHVDVQYSDSELEALLLESKLVKELSPIHNRQLRRSRSLFLLKATTNNTGYLELHIEPGTFNQSSRLSEIYGVYASKKRAQQAIEYYRSEYSLCPKLCGLEHMKGACFLSQLRKCGGACIGAEEPDQYNVRVNLALIDKQFVDWPYGGKIIFKASARSNLVLDNWQVIGKMDMDDNLDDSLSTEFNVDNYKIIRSALKKHPEKIIAIN